MRNSIARAVSAIALSGITTVVLAAPAFAQENPTVNDPDEVAIVGEPDTSDLHNAYTFAPLGVPVFGLLQSVNAVPGNILPGT
ncbi:hypothetical protein EV191_11194 [Tamaricihabitans halophyticus]|uniref:Secreted protein n=1 Tax=Tamaricihabitans halophyticus TaxID=1262583 RepID=A0A4R2QGR0_9PSEU|nr:hypothetical protein [Tamaricihabitans halophyticus]TCP47889.1 hypothetical protein EV191_11194 [Tamaricihabitans halophyticus]